MHILGNAFTDLPWEAFVSVRQSLLAILDQGPCYGYQLRNEFERRTSAAWPLNVGQIYNTLERLERDGLVERGEADELGHVYWHITTAGSAEVAVWLSSPVVRASGARDELAVKIALAATLPGVDLTAILRAQRAASLSRLQDLRNAILTDDEPAGAAELARALIDDAAIFTAEAEVRWLEHADNRLAGHPRHALALELETERPRRGRPAKTAAPHGV